MTPRTVPDLVAEQARLTPDAVAVEDATERLTYAELLARADALAHRLVALDVAPGEVVALHAERTAAGLAALLGIWRAGAAYLPLDPEAPPARLEALASDASCRLLVGGAAAHALGIRGVEVVRHDAPADEAPTARALPTPDAQGLAYVLYTSGSTGAPKGVLVAHEGLCHRALVQREMFPMAVGERVSQFTSLGWDASLFEILLAWGSGATLCLIPPAVRRSGDALARFLGEQRIDVAFFPPSVLATIPPAPLPRLRIMMVGGEACPRALVERWGGARRFVNHYGPTETTVWMSTDECRAGETPTLGRAIRDVDVLVLDPQTRAVLPVGATGELAIGGIGLAAGYLGRPDATHARFVPHPADPDRLVYLTGDLARLLPDGRMEFHGRLDRQVKVRGVRIELEEVEAALLDVPGVREAAVALDRDARGDARLVAYVVPRQDAAAAAEPTLASEPLRRALRESLAARLPEAMVPSVYVQLAALPRLANDKLDRARLPPPSSLASVRLSIEEAPRNETERLVAEAFAEELGLPHVGRHQGFFDLGGHSLLAAHVQARLQQALGRDVDIVEIYEHPTVAALAARLAPDAARPALAAAPAALAGADRGAARAAAAARRRLDARGTSEGAR